MTPSTAQPYNAGELGGAFLVYRTDSSFGSFANPRPGRNYEISFECPEFTCLCPRTGQPDFATIRIAYTPGEHCVELKSLKLYLWSYRNAGAFHEEVTNRILDDLVSVCRPVRIRVVGRFSRARRNPHRRDSDFPGPVRHSEIAPPISAGGRAAPFAGKRRHSELILLLAPFPPGSSFADMPAVLIKGGAYRWYREPPIPHVWVLVEGDRIKKIGKAGSFPKPRGAEVLQLGRDDSPRPH